MRESKEQSRLKWAFDDAGEWTADSSMSFLPDEPDLRCTYRIQVCADGTFDLSRSDGQLQLDGMPCLQSLSGAQSACEIREALIIRLAV